MTEDDVKDFYKTAFNRGVDFGFELGHKMCFEKYHSNKGAPMQPRAFTPTSGTTTEYVVNEQTGGHTLVFLCIILKFAALVQQSEPFSTS